MNLEVCSILLYSSILHNVIHCRTCQKNDQHLLLSPAPRLTCLLAIANMHSTSTTKYRILTPFFYYHGHPHHAWCNDFEDSSMLPTQAPLMHFLRSYFACSQPQLLLEQPTPPLPPLPPLPPPEEFSVDETEGKIFLSSKHKFAKILTAPLNRLSFTLRAEQISSDCTAQSCQTLSTSFRSLSTPCHLCVVLSKYRRLCILWFCKTYKT